MKNLRWLATAWILLAFSLASIAADWSHWRGPEQNGVSRDRGLPESWSPDPKAADNNLLWKASYGSRSTPLIQNGRVYLINNIGEGINEQERVLCLNANTGQFLWEHKFNVFLTDIVSVRLGWTNLAGDPETGNVYAHGTQGFLICFDKDGKILWSHSLTEEYGRISGYGGRVTTPIVDGDLVCISMLNASWGDQGRGGNRFVAFDKRTGEPVWWASTGCQPKDTYYSCPVVAVIDGQRLLISGGGDGGVHAFKVRTGEKVWSYFFGSGAVNCSPVVDGSRVYIGQGEENLDNNIQGNFICLDASKVNGGAPELVWRHDDLKAKYASPIIHEGRIYISDETAKLFCLDAKDGKKIWTFNYGRNCKGSPVWADGKIYVADVNARFHILQPGDKKCKRLHQQFFPSGDPNSDVEINGSPAIVNGRVYFTTRDEIYCLGKKDAQPGIPEPAASQEPAFDPNAKPVSLQIFPCDVVLHPGEKQTFKARLLDNNGRVLKETKAQWSLTPMGLPPGVPAPRVPPPALKGEISAEGVLTVDAQMPGQFGGVSATADGLTAHARVRVAPKLPYTQDFEKVPEGKIPGGWVNCQGKFAVEKRDESLTLKKLANNASPLVCRAYTYITTPNAKGYTIQADVLGTKKNEDLPDMGVLNCRYSLTLDGNKQRLRLLSWEALPRVDQSIDWPWAPDTWYTLKLQVEAKEKEAVVRGKAWKRGENEPEKWTIEFTDPCPNTQGAAGLYGYATGILDQQVGAEIFYDNVKIQ